MGNRNHLCKGDRVEHADPRISIGPGTVGEGNDAGVRVDWDNNTWGLYPWDRSININAYELLKLKKGAKV